MNIIKQIIKEAYIKQSFKEDMAPQAIILMGLPASGKSTFINTGLTSYFSNVPHVSAFKVLNSDAQLKKVQYNRSIIDYNNLQNLDESNYIEAIYSMFYISNDGAIVHFPLDYNSFKNLKNHNEFWSKTYKEYYASYFGEREQAKQDTKELEDHKITGAHIIIVDTTGQNVTKNLSLLEKTKKLGYTNSIVFLDIPIEYSIGRDTYRGAMFGRSVGKETILSIDSKLSSAFSSFANSSLVDRIMKFKWQGNVFKGEYVLMIDKKKYPYK